MSKHNRNRFRNTVILFAVLFAVLALPCLIGGPIVYFMVEDINKGEQRIDDKANRLKRR